MSSSSIFSRVISLSLLLALALITSGANFRLDLDSEELVDKVYEKSAATLTPSERQFLEEILKADDILMERQRRGIVDQILVAISGVSTNLVGSPSQSQVAATSAPATTTIATTIATNTMASNKVAAEATTTQAPATAANNNDNHLFNQISKVIISSGRRNVTGIVDEALKIGTPAPVRELVNGILSVAYCNGIRRLLGRC